MTTLTARTARLETLAFAAANMALPPSARPEATAWHTAASTVLPDPFLLPARYAHLTPARPAPARPSPWRRLARLLSA